MTESLLKCQFRITFSWKHEKKKNQLTLDFHGWFIGIVVNDIETFDDAKRLMEQAFIDYNAVRPHSSIDYLAPDEFERRWNEDESFRTEFMDKRSRMEERRMKNRIERKRRLKENVSLEDEISVQN